MSGVGRVGGAGNPWGNYGSTTNQPSGFPTQAPTSSPATSTQSNRSKVQQKYRASHPQIEFAVDFKSFQTTPKPDPKGNGHNVAEHKYRMTHPREKGPANQKNMDGLFIRDEYGYLDAPHERE